jgi:prophage maintenance system killer protein
MVKKKYLPSSEIQESIQRWKEDIKRIFNVATGWKYEEYIRSEANLEFIIGNSFKIKDAKELAAHFMYNIAKRQPFFNGNKRTALLTSLIVLGKTICKDKKEFFIQKFKEYAKQSKEEYHQKYQSEKRLVDFMKEITEGKRRFNEVENFIEKQFIEPVS